MSDAWVRRSVGEERARDRGTTEPRPAFMRWLRYAFGGGLPQQYSAWVLHDATCATWVVRHIARALVVVTIPAIALLLFLPTTVDIRVLTVVTVTGCQLLLLGILTNEVTERRVHKAGYAWGTASEIRTRRAVEDQRRAVRARRERRADRRQPRR